MLLCYLRSVEYIEPHSPGWDPGQLAEPHEDNDLARARWRYALYSNSEMLEAWRERQRKYIQKYGAMRPWTEEQIIKRTTDRYYAALDLRRAARAERKVARLARKAEKEREKQNGNL